MVEQMPGLLQQVPHIRPALGEERYVSLSVF
jgi:hypothetical protein